MHVLWFSISFISSALVTRAMLIVSERANLYDTPNHRSSHDRPIPRLGGVGIVVGSLLGIAIAGATADARIAAVSLGALAMAIVGLIDDLRPIAARTKLALQLFVAGSVVIAVQPQWTLDLPGLTLSVTSWHGLVAAAIWIVGMCNAVNFMDGIDGLAASSIAAVALAASVFGGDAGSVMFLAIASAAGGFLIWNWHPASIFMGDSGSQFLGFAVASGLLISADGMPVIPALILLAPLLLDSGVTLAARAARHERLFEPHRGHLYQRLSDSYGQRRVAAGYVMATAGCAGAAVVYQMADDMTQGGILALCAIAVTAVLLTQRDRWLRG